MQQLFDEGRLAANTYFVTGPSCAPVPGMTQRDEWVDCAKVPSKLLELVQREKVQSVVLGAAWSGYRSENSLIERAGRRLPVSTTEGEDAFYANLEDYIRQLQRLGAAVYLVRGAPNNIHFNPAQMIVRHITGVRISSDFDKPEFIAKNAGASYNR